MIGLNTAVFLMWRVPSLHRTMARYFTSSIFNSESHDTRIAGNFRGIQFSRFSRISGYQRKLDPRNKYNCTVYSRHDRTRPRNLNRENFEDWSSAKIGPHDNFPLYSNNGCYSNQEYQYTCSLIITLSLSPFSDFHTHCSS